MEGVGDCFTSSCVCNYAGPSVMMARKSVCSQSDVTTVLVNLIDYQLIPSNLPFAVGHAVAETSAAMSPQLC